MGIYIDKGNGAFAKTRQSEYIDKSGLIALINRTLNTRQQFTCVTRSRRFGKSMAAEMLAAYYDRSCDSRSLFADLQIVADATFEEHLNKYPVLFMDLTDFTKGDIKGSIVDAMEKRLIADIRTAYPKVPVPRGGSLMDYLLRIHIATGDSFIFIIDEWDSILREAAQKSNPHISTRQADDYSAWLRRMFKSASGFEVFAGVYMTGILPIKKYITDSALNNFIEYSMITPRRMASFFGFTKDEVKMLAAKHQMDYCELEKWYDGYQIGIEPSMFNPNSVMQAIDNGRCESFWASTGAFDAVAGYIQMNFDGLKDSIVDLLASGRVSVNTTKFRNDLSDIRSRDEVLTVLIHLGYLSFDWERRECYVPNYEVSGELANAVEETGWTEVVAALQQSRHLLDATLRGDEQTVAALMEAAHTANVSIVKYNNENSMACVLAIAYYYAHGDYIFHREYQTGKGYADLVLMPRKNVQKPAIIVELKYGHSPEEAIAQIKERRYQDKVKEYTGDILLVGISYDKKAKTHQCRIETLNY